MTLKLRWTLMVLGLPVITGCAASGGWSALAGLTGAGDSACTGAVPAHVGASHGAGGAVAMTWPSACNDYPVSYRAQPR